MANKFSAADFLIRWVFALVLVFGTYNPTDYCYISWLSNSEFSVTPLMALVGIILLIGWIIYLRATALSLGVLGVALFAALFACFIWLFVDLGWLSLENTGAMTWIVLVLLSLVLAMGMSWSHIRRQISGQVSTDDLEN
ncbi:MAG: hypothetical protein Hals2KO_20860 [Halioglobus sp.]